MVAYMRPTGDWSRRRGRRERPTRVDRPEQHQRPGIDASMELFRGLSADQIDIVEQYLTPVDFKAGTELTRQGQPARQFVVIVDGTVAVTRNGLPVGVLRRGQHFGETPLLRPDAGTEYRVSSHAVTDVRIAVGSPRDLSSLLHHLPVVDERVRELADLRQSYLDGTRRPTIDRPPSSPPRRRRLEIDRAGREADVLIVADRTVGGLSTVSWLTRAREDADVRSAHLVVPAERSKHLRHYPTVDGSGLEIMDHDAHDEAQQRLELGLGGLRSCGVTAHGEIGSADPFVAVQDAMRRVGYRRILIAHRPGWVNRRRARSLARRVAKAYPRAQIELVTGAGDESLAALSNHTQPAIVIDDRSTADREREHRVLTEYPVSIGVNGHD